MRRLEIKQNQVIQSLQGSAWKCGLEFQFDPGEENQEKTRKEAFTNLGM